DQLAGQFVADAAHSLGWDTPGLPDPGTSTAAGQLAWLAGRLADGTGTGSSEERDAVTRQLGQRFEVFQAHIQMMNGYQPASPGVRAPALIVSADRSPNAPTRDLWPGVLDGPVSTLGVDSDHYAFLRPPLIADVGTWIRTRHCGSEEAPGRGA
ncbi:MAG TPA: hypothetical protein VGI64_09315, partial [Streptosporangiaceae bacterium]